MDRKLLRLKKAAHAVLLVLLLSAAGMMKGYAYYDFSAVCETGQTLYYTITDAENHYVELSCPGNPNNWFYDWSGYTKPTGNIILPENVEYGGVTYSVTSIGSSAFRECYDLTGDLTIPTSVTSIGPGAFLCCGFTGRLTIPTSVTTISGSAFEQYSTADGFTEFYYNAINCEDFPAGYVGPFDLALRNVSYFIIGPDVARIPARLFYNSCFQGAIVSFAETPPPLGVDAFGGNYGVGLGPSTTVYVPCESKEAYTSIPWGGSNHIIGMCGGITVAADPVEGGTVMGGGAFEPGQTCTLTATANEGYTFMYWTENDEIVSSDAVYTFMVLDNRELVAHFALPFTVSVTADPPQGGTLTGAGLYDYGTMATVTATANEGYYFANLQHGATVTLDAEYTFIVTEDANVVAHFVTDGNIVFLDPNVKAICVAHWDTNGDGELSYLEAAQVTDLGNWFQGNTVITSFNELQYFIGLSAIPNNAFQNCTGLTSITLPPTIVTIGNYAFSGCTGLFGLLTLPSVLVTIGDYAYYNCSGFIASLTIPNTVTTIGSHAFENCTGFMGWLTIGNSVTTIGNSAFAGCYNFTGSINIPNSVVSIGNSAFYGCTAFWGNLTIGNSVTTIGSSAFYGCTGLVGNVDIPNSVASIGYNAFYNCHSFDGSLTIPASVTSIDGGAFSSCYGFSAVYYNATSSADCSLSAFSQCSGTLTIGNNVQRIPANIFGYANFTGSLDIPNSVTTIGNSAFYNCDDLTGSLVIPNSVTSVGTYAFYNCHSFTGTLTLSNAMNTVAQGSFQNCYNFTGDLVIPSSVVSIADDAFHNCQHFTGTLVLPNPLNTIGISAFEDCDGLSEIIMGNNVLVVGNTAFKSCSGLTKVTLPYPVIVIGIEAFRDCNHLVEVNMQAWQAPSIGWDVFLNNAAGRLINIPCGATPNYSAGYWTEWADALHEMCDELVVTAEVNPAVAGSVTGAGTFGYSEMCTLTATGNLGYPFLNWTKNGVVVSTEPVYTFGVTESCTLVANFPEEPVSYDITATVNIEEGGTIDGAGSYLHGATATLTATPNTAYRFVNWTKDGEVVSTETEYSFTVTEASAYTANFELNSYEITATANPEAGGIVDGAGTYNHGATCTLTATANDGYTFINWTKDGEEVSTNTTYSFTATEAGNYMANFELNTYEITVTANPTDGGTVSGAGTYDHGTTATLTATTNEGYTFINWTKDGEEVSTSTTYSFTVTEAGDYMANFELNTYEITVTANPEAGGTVDGAGVYDHGEICTLTATANQNYFFVNWTKDGEVVSTETEYSFTVTEAGAYTANFELNSYEITATANPEEGGTITGVGTYTHGQYCILTAVANTGYTFLNWTKDNTVVATTAIFSFPVLAAGEYVANFELNSYEITATANPEEGGTVTGIGSYDYGETATLTAMPNLGYSFVNWVENDSVVSTEAEYTFTVTSDKSLTANFGLDVYFIAVTRNPLEGGMVEGGGGFNYGGLATVTAVPNTGYAFVSWTENEEVVSTESIYTFIVTGSRDLVANFEQTDITQTTNINDGWTWWSSSIETAEADVLDQLKTGLGASGIIIKSQTQSTMHVGNNWFGTLEMTNESSYMVKATAEVEVDITGPAATPENHPITLTPGWTWIGYPSIETMTVAEALANHIPQANDVIKGQNASAMFMMGQWRGSLTLTPGIGLMYKSNNSEAVTLTYATPTRIGETEINPVEPHWRVNYNAYPTNMTVLVVVELDGKELALRHPSTGSGAAQGPDANYELAAFANGECRGSVAMMYIEPLDCYMALLTIAGEESDNLRFALYNTEAGEEYHNAIETLTYEADAVVGSPEAPFVIRFRNTMGIDEWANSLQVFPNPVERGQILTLGMTDEIGEVQVEIIDALGSVVETRRATSLQTITAPQVAGVYMLRITVEGKGTCYRKLVVR
jgi:hypothetical protein